MKTEKLEIFFYKSWFRGPLNPFAKNVEILNSDLKYGQGRSPS